MIHLSDIIAQFHMPILDRSIKLQPIKSTFVKKSLEGVLAHQLGWRARFLGLVISCFKNDDDSIVMNAEICRNEFFIILVAVNQSLSPATEIFQHLGIEAALRIGLANGGAGFPLPAG